MTPKQWQALDLMLYELQADHDIPPMGLMGIDLMRRMAVERMDAAQRLLRQVDRIEAAFDSALRGESFTEVKAMSEVKM